MARLTQIFFLFYKNILLETTSFLAFFFFSNGVTEQDGKTERDVSSLPNSHNG